MEKYDSDSFLYSKIRTVRLSTDEIDEMRQKNIAYEYLCHLEEARLWIQTCIKEDLPTCKEFEQRLQNGVYFARLAHYIAPHIVPMKKIFDSDQRIYDVSGLHYRHTDNINYWLLAMKTIGLPSYFYPNAFDVYGKKNMPKAIYCIHALSLYLYRYSEGIKIMDLLGKIHFTSEEINSVQLEFKEFNIKLPAFGKIGGTLTSEITTDDSALHAAVIAINMTINDQNSENLLSALMNPNAKLNNVISKYHESYLSSLCERKLKKSSEIQYKKINLYNVPEMYATFLSHESIQEVIDAINFSKSLTELNEAVLLNNSAYFETTLRQEFLSIMDIISDNCNMYMEAYKEICEKDCEGLTVDKFNLQNIVLAVNNKVSENKEIKILLDLNSALDGDNSSLLLNLLQSDILKIKSVYDFGILFYHSQLRKIKGKGRQLSIDELKNNMHILSALIEVSMAVFEKDSEEVFEALSNPVLQIENLNPSYKNEYYHSILSVVEMLNSESKILTFEQVKMCIVKVNDLKQKDKEMHFLKNINSAISSGCAELLLNALYQAKFLTCIQSKHKDLYLQFLLQYKCTKKDFNMLSFEEIQDQINFTNKLAFDAEYQCTALAAINIAIDNKDSQRLFETVQTFYKDIQICENCKEIYLKYLLDFKTEKLQKCAGEKHAILSFPWIKHTVSSSLVFYLNIQTLETEWNKKEIPGSFFMDSDEILDKIVKVRCNCKYLKGQNLEMFTISLQARIRGFLFRRSICIQNGKGISHPFDQEQAVCKIQSFIRMSLVRRKYLEKKAEKMKLDRAARLIQRLWQAFKIKQNLKLLTHSPNPPLSLIQKIINMLEISNDDYSDEFKLHNIKGKVVQTIRRNQELAKEVDDMDIKIGLLIRNRLTLQDLENQKSKVLSKKRIKLEKSIKDQDSDKSLNLFNQKNNVLVRAYENLLYLIQTKSIYLARLIVSLPSNQASVFIESVIFSLYNYGSTPREEYLLLNLLCMALEEEIKCKVDKISDIITGDHLIMKIIISFYRKGQRQDCLRELLQPLTLKALEDECLVHSTNPVEIYKLWQNEIEIESGKKSLLPYEVTLKDALSHEEVNHHLNLFLDNLLKHSLAFCKAIVNCQKLIPFGMKHAAKVLKIALQRKYPYAPLKELYKIIGNFLYYRYINPAIVAPDSFEIIDLNHNEQLDDNSRLKLSFIGNFLQFAATGKTYTEESSHLMCLNPYLNDCHEKFMLFFEDICKIEEPEEYFNISVFYEAVIPEPTVYLTIQELNTLHKLIIEKAYELAPDPNDILHEILDDFSTLSIDDMFKNRKDIDYHTEICFSLRSKHAVEFDDETDEEKTYVETKFMLITLLQVFCCQASVTELLKKQPSVEEEEKFEKICFMKQNDTDISRNWIRKFRDWKTLSSFNTVLQYNLNILELAGYVSSKNDYQDILNDIAKDIINRWKYRINRKEDILKLIEVQKQLDLKTVHYLEKLDFYNKYIEACLENLESGRRRIHKKIFSRHQETNPEVKNMKTLKYSGSKLYEKGILLEIKDLDIQQFKNVLFEIKPSQDAGIFVVEAKFMGVLLNSIAIDIQDLLAMKYQGTAIMTVFDCVKINCNLLLHFLNCKFYGKL